MNRVRRVTRVAARLGVIALIGAPVAGQDDAPAEPGVPRKLSHSIWGSSGTSDENVFVLMRSALSQTICLSVSRTAKSAEEIAEEIQADRADIEAMAQRLAHERILVRTDDGKYLANFYALEAEHAVGRAELIRSAGVAVADVIARNLHRLRRAYLDTPLAGDGCEWVMRAEYVVVGVLLCNVGVSRNSPVSVPRPDERPSGGRYWQFGQEEADGFEPVHGTGLHNTCTGTLCYGVLNGFGDYWQGLAELSQREQEALSSVVWGTEDVGALRHALECTLNEAHVVIHDLGNYGLVTDEQGRLRPGIPVITDAESHLLAPVIDDIADEMWEEALWPAFEGLEGLLEEWGYGHVRDQYAATLGVASNAAASEAVRVLLARGLLTPVPENPPPGFAYLAWEHNTAAMRSGW